MANPFGPVSGRSRAHFLRTAAVLCAVVALALTSLQAASAADERLEKAQEKRQEVQEELDALNADLERTRAAVDDAEAELAELRDRTAAEKVEAEKAAELWTGRIRESYKNGSGDPVLDILTADDPTAMLEQARYLSWVSAESRTDLEAARAAAVRVEALKARSEELAAELTKRQEELVAQRDRTDELLEEAVEAEEEVKALIAKEEAARRAAAARASRSSGSVAAASAEPAPVSGGVACPVNGARTYVDSWGAPRSGGRSHKGTDILAPHGTPTPAYENGVVSRLSTNGLGGISLYLQGDSGNQYYYTHLSGYANVSEGQRVSAGQVLAYVGATGNARGINHLHFEVRPGGGGNVNPYPYVLRACG